MKQLPKYKKGDQAVFNNNKFEVLEVDDTDYLIEWIAGPVKGNRHKITHTYLDTAGYILYTGPRDKSVVYEGIAKTRASDLTQFRQECKHETKLKYHGFSQTYEFCKACDAKFYPKN